MSQHVYKANEHRFFDSLVAFTASVSSLGLAIDAQACGVAKSYSSSDYLTLEGSSKASGVEFRFFPIALMTTLVQNGWPSSLAFEELAINSAPPPKAITLTGLQGVHGAMISSAFVKYFEEYRSLVEARCTKDVKNWPSVWNFGRVIRNALAHKGQIKFDNQNASPVIWRKLKYSPSDNGKQVLYQDMTSVELILLMEEMDANV